MSGATTPETPQSVDTTADDASEDAADTAAGNDGGDGNDGSGGDEGARPERARRFSLTRSTARPEGGGRAVGGDAPAPARQWPILAVTGLAAVGLVLVAADAFRVGIVFVGAALLTGALLRFVLPSVGMLAVRSRFTDVITYAVLGTVIVLLALMAQPDPILELPFLEDVIRFTVR